MALKRDYYESLGVSRESGPEDLKKAFRQLALQYHPDRNPGDKSAEERFKEINEAYSVLSDPDKRRQYDSFGHAGPAGQGFGGFGDFSGFGVEDIINDFFGGMICPERIISSSSAGVAPLRVNGTTRAMA